MYEQNSANPFTSAASNALFALQEHRASNAATTSTPQSSPASIPQNLFASPPSVQPSSVINLSNSSDVVIGPMTQYQGPVTIYQYMDATVQARSMRAGGGINNSQQKDSTTFVQSIAGQSKLLILLLIVVVITSGVVTYLLLDRKNNETTAPSPILFGRNYEGGTFPNLGNGHLIVDREQWGASDQITNLTIKLNHPIPYVMITHVGVQSTPCFNIYKCSIKMRTIQDSSIAEKGLKDISSNFYVGGDGNIYVGRGWDYANAYANNTLAITFMGDYIRHEPSERQFEATQYLLAYGITNKHLAIDYKLVAQNQTKSSRSPGSYVYREIIKWPHWYPCGIDANPKCGSELGLPEIWLGNL